MIEYQTIGQRDPAWASSLLGNSTASTIGSYGCLLCCYAMLAGVDPLTMQSTLKRCGGFVPGSAMMSTVFIPHVLDNRIVTYKGISGWYQGPVAPPALAQLRAWLQVDGQAAVCVVDPTPGNPGLQGDEMHFVLAVGCNAAGATIHDPWFNDQAGLAPRYGHDDAAALYQWRLYSIEETAVTL